MVDMGPGTNDFIDRSVWQNAQHAVVLIGLLLGCGFPAEL